MILAPAISPGDVASAGAAEPSHVELRNLCVRRDQRDLVRDLNLDVPRGSFVAVVGPSGVGKSSLLACLAGMLEPGAGTITYRCAQRCDHSPNDFQKRLGLVFQHLRLTLNASVLTNVCCGVLGQRGWWRTLLGFSRDERKQAKDLLERFGLKGYERLPVAKISGGERQRTAIARALMQSPELILADEPVASLDPALARNVLGYLRDETRKNQRTVFCVLHDPDLVAEFADYTLTLSRVCPAAWKLRAAD
ncbi:MAG: ATP-binding cassette domain-containing protein [Chthoniobacterales bacterium]